MAGTRLAAHTCFLIYSLISVLIAWRLGLVKRAPLPLEEMVDPLRRDRLPSIDLGGGESERGGEPLPLPVDVDVVLLRGPGDAVDCPSCAAALDAMQANPSLARNAFIKVQQAEHGEQEQEQHAATASATASAAAAAASGREPRRLQHQDASLPQLFDIREVNLRIVHADHGHAAAAAPPPSSEPAALDDWLHRSFVLPRRLQQQQQEPSKAETAAADDLAPRYTFFIACAGAGDAGEVPTFVMGKRRHGYLGLGCAGACTCGKEKDAAVPAAAKQEVGSGPVSTSPTATAAAAARGGGASSGIASAVLQALAGIIAAHILRSPVPAGDVHVRLGQAYRLSFSLLTEDPGERRCTWDFAAASRRYLRPMLRKLHPVASFDVQSQEVQYARLVPSPPRMYTPQNRWYYTPLDLEGFLGLNDFSTLDLAAGWGPGEATGGGADSNNSTSAVSAPHSQVPVNFMVFCPTPKFSPLLFMEDWNGAGGRNRPAAVAYEVPGFGGVSVVNVDGDTGADGVVDVLGPERLRRVLGAHASQLRRIIGLPRSSDRPSEVPWPWFPRPEATEGGSGCGSCPISTGRRGGRLPLIFLPSPTDGVTDWEVDALLRAGLARNRAAAAETLRSLAALVESQTEMEVSTKVAEDVAAALAALVKTDAAVLRSVKGGFKDAQAVSASGRGRDGGGTGATPGDRAAPCSQGKACEREEGLAGGGGGWAHASAMRWAREALRRSEAAYFDPTMIPQLYFPQDHLMAVYLPFLGPLAFPLLWGFAQELWRYLKKRKTKRERAREGGGGQESTTRTEGETWKSEDGVAR